MKQWNFKKGKVGERLAQDLLVKEGYRIIEVNFHTRFGEIDIIAAKGRFLVFIEVKLKVGADFGLPEEMITSGKLRQIRQMAEVYLRKNPGTPDKYPQCRIDAVCITLNQDETIDKIRHYENIQYN
jgi:putative endonuclease